MDQLVGQLEQLKLELVLVVMVVNMELAVLLAQMEL